MQLLSPVNSLPLRDNEGHDPGGGHHHLSYEEVVYVNPPVDKLD